MLQNCSVKEPPFLTKALPATKSRNFEKVPVTLDISKESPGSVPFFEQKLPFLGPAGIRSPASVITAQPIRGSMPETTQSFFLSSGIRPSGSHNTSYINQKLQSRDLLESDKKVQKQVEPNSPRPLNMNVVDYAGNGPFSKISKVEVFRSMEFSPNNINFSQSGSFKLPDHSNGVAFGELPNGKVVVTRADGNTLPSLSGDLTKPGGCYPHDRGQRLSDPVQLMRMLADHNQQKTSNQSLADAPQVLPSAPSLSNNDPNNEAMAAARAWMTVGARGLRPVTENVHPNKNHMYGYPPNIHSQISRVFPSSGMHVRPDKNSAPIHAFVPQGPIPMLVGNQIQVQNQRMPFPHLAPADLSRFQLQSSWRNVSPQIHSRQKQDSLPPDLNIGFQSSGSPARPSSGVLVDSQQPDLALQL